MADVRYIVPYPYPEPTCGGCYPNHFVMDWYGLSQEKLTAMRNVAPNLSYTR